MATPIPTITITLSIPEMAQLIQANNDLRDEIQNLSRRMHAVETQMTIQNTNSSVPHRELDHDTSSAPEHHVVQQDVHAQINGDAHQNGHARHDHNNDSTEDHDLVNEHDSAHEHELPHDTSPSIDEGFTVHRVSPTPAIGRKRKRTTITGKSPYITRSDFVVRGSDTQLAQKRVEAGPSRSESPFDSNNDGHDSSIDELEVMPPVRPATKSPRNRTQRLENSSNQTDETVEDVALKTEEPSRSQYGRVRIKAQPPPGFVDTPKLGELAKMCRQRKK